MIKMANCAWLVLLLTTVCISANATDVTATIRVDRSSATKQVTPADVVLWLVPLDAPVTRPMPKPNVRLLQKNKEFVPHMLVVPTGTSVDFPNLDPFFHNVFSLFNGKRFDLGLYEAGTHRSVTFDREGVSYIFCNIHPEMGAVVISLTSPYFAVSDTNGSVTIRDVPPGRYRLQTWAEQLVSDTPSQTDRVIEISATKYDLGDLHFHLTNAVATHHKNKFGKDYATDISSPY